MPGSRPDWQPVVIRSARRTLALEVHPDGQVILRAPLQVPDTEIARFLEERRAWVDSHLAKQRRAAAAPAEPPLSREELQALSREAADVLPGRTAYFARLMGVRYGRITIRCQKTRWGSCTAEGNISYNCLLMLTPPEVRDYVTVHELAHRRHMDHSALFWAEVERMLPDYRDRRRWLKEHGGKIMERVFHRG